MKKNKPNKTKQKKHSNAKKTSEKLRVFYLKFDSLRFKAFSHSSPTFAVSQDGTQIVVVKDVISLFCVCNFQLSSSTSS